MPAPRIDQPDETSLSPLFYLFTATQRAHALLARAMADSPLRSDALLALMNAAEQALNEFEGAETEATG